MPDARVKDRHRQDADQKEDKDGGTHGIITLCLVSVRRRSPIRRPWGSTGVIASPLSFQTADPEEGLPLLRPRYAPRWAPGVSDRFLESSTRVARNSDCRWSIRDNGHPAATPSPGPDG